MSRVPALAERLLDLVCIKSSYGEERVLCDWVETHLRARLGDAEVHRHGDSVLGWLRSTSGETRPSVGLVGHLDVVRTHHGAPPRIDGDRLYGPGAADMKSGLALMLDLLDHADRSRLAYDLAFVFYDREEGPFDDNGLGPLLAARPDLCALDLALCLEPSDNKLQLGCMGSLHARVVVEGRSAHSARPWQGENAVLKSLPLLERLRDEVPIEVTIDGMSYREVTSLTLANAGRARNVIPDRFELNVNHRFSPASTLAQAEARVRALVESSGVPATVDVVDRAPSAAPCASHPLVQRLADCGVSAIEPKQAWTDVARFAALGVPAVNWGPGTQAQAHQPDEWTSLPQLTRGREILMCFLGLA